VEVVATGSRDRFEFIRSLGAAEVLGYQDFDLKSWVKEGEGEGEEADMVIDCVGRQALAHAWWAVKEGGTLISIFQPPKGDEAGRIREE
jgi:NADPH:quinone reductase-like Zn-dependent oxidoreductase